ncbi:MAG: DUF3108 domain-containing protein [Sulfuriferula multivorans]|uniref:DUF3108 domain-containing protein n=1 Tax=Sulfuriferula multivorans TaxID=1559896 RepID=A0A7C9TB14_9PROT|nr:DUF3108 domain-containing protein [Sulfuriferula multivorans]
MGRSLRPWWLALGVSLLLHALLIGGANWSLPTQELPAEPIRFEARLVSLAAPPPPVANPAVSAPPVYRGPLPAENPVQKAAPPGVVSTDPIKVSASTEPVVSVDTPPVALPGPVQVAAAAPVLIEVAPPPLNPLPARIDLRFKVSYGLAAGEQTMVWVNEDGQHYTLISVAEATGLAGIFYHGKFVQTSRGRITPHGLQPEEFWDQRGDKRSSAQFDASQGHLTLNPDKGTPRHFKYEGEVQDVLSLFFHLALTAPPPGGTLTYSVFNGKKLRDYSYMVRGEVILETAVGSLRTLHLARVTDSDGRFEIWLAIDRHYLPVRVLRSDDKGNEVELRIQSIVP